MKLKFCGLTRPADIDAANQAHPDYIGFVFAPSRRRVSDVQADQLRARLHPSIRAVGVFVNDRIEHIASLVENGVIDAVQLHGDEDAEYIRELRRQTSAAVIRAVRVSSREDVEHAQHLPVQYLLFDTFSEQAQGGTGQVFDWSMLEGAEKPFFLAGGIDESNIARALETGAFALDLSSGIETNGVKDAEKMRRIAQMVRSYAK